MGKWVHSGHVLQSWRNLVSTRLWRMKENKNSMVTARFLDLRKNSDARWGRWCCLGGQGRWREERGPKRGRAVEGHVPWGSAEDSPPLERDRLFESSMFLNWELFPPFPTVFSLFAVACLFRRNLALLWSVLGFISKDKFRAKENDYPESGFRE